MTEPDHPGSIRGEVFETRIALSFFGGVSLAVYESGTAVEFFRLVTGDGIYRKLHEQIGPVIVDIISGTSAGGLSAAFLATALINGSPNLDPLIRLWLKKASFDTLLTPSGSPTAASLFNGDHFLELIEEALNQIAGDGGEPYQEYLDLFMTATSLDGDVSSFKLNDQNIAARSHQRVFRFRYRGKDVRQRNIGEPEHNDFDAKHRSLLAIAARASASFPLVFKPVSIKREDFKYLSPELKTDSLHIDGGILDNKPIRLALEAVFQRRADKQIDRRLFYVEPIPEDISDTREADDTMLVGGTDLSWTPLRVLYAAVKDLPSYQSITSALDELSARNRELSELRHTLDHYEALAGRAQAEVPDVSRLLPNLHLASPYYPGRTYIPATDKATHLFRAQEDSYLDLRLSRSDSPLFHACKQISDDLLKGRAKSDSEPLEALYHLKNRILWTFDFEFHRRHYQYLHQVIRQLFTQLDEGELLHDRHDRLILFHSLNRLRTRLNNQEAEILQRREQFERVKDSLENKIMEMLPALSPALCAGDARQITELINISQYQIAILPEVKEQYGFFYRLRDEAKLDLEQERHRIDLDAMGARNNPQFRPPLEEGYNFLKLALDQFYDRDMIIYPMMNKSGMGASELQPVRAARFGPLEGIHYLNLSEQRHKVAGETAFNFGGFMNESWRGNDLIWGRLDAVETIFRQLLPDGEKNPLFRELLGEQKRIVVEMREKFQVGIVHPLSKQDKDGNPPHEDLLIGKQNIHDIADRTKVVWLRQGIGTAVRMIFFPHVPLPPWCQRCFSGLFVRVLISPRRVLLLTAFVCAAIILGLSAVAAHFAEGWLPKPGSLPAKAGEVSAFLWILLLGFLCFAIAQLVHSLRAKFLRRDSPPKKTR